MDEQHITGTDFHFPGQTAVYHGKVRDVYTVHDDLLVSVASDRLSAFDVILPRPIPYKGQVLNQLAAHFLEQTGDVVPNWLQAVPDPNASAGRKAVPFKIEMVIRSLLIGHAWREYKAGSRLLCGLELPDGMQEYDRFPEPLITPSTKAEGGHDEDIAAAEIITRGLASQEQWDQLCDMTHRLFARGQAMAAERGLVLADTKYEFGLLNRNIIVIDEVHTPDSSRYFYAKGYQAYMEKRTDERPAHLSKEFVREWLLGRGFSGQDGQAPPEMSDGLLEQISNRYIELYERLTGQDFVKADSPDPLARIEKNVRVYLEQR